MCTNYVLSNVNLVLKKVQTFEMIQTPEITNMLLGLNVHPSWQIESRYCWTSEENVGGEPAQTHHGRGDQAAGHGHQA